MSLLGELDRTGFRPVLRNLVLVAAFGIIVAMPLIRQPTTSRPGVAIGVGDKSQTPSAVLTPTSGLISKGLSVMLVLTRKCSESIKIGEDIVVRVIQTGRSTVKIGIEAPPHVRVLRAELAPNTDVSSHGASLSSYGAPESSSTPTMAPSAMMPNPASSRTMTMAPRPNGGSPLKKPVMAATMTTTIPTSSVPSVPPKGLLTDQPVSLGSILAHVNASYVSELEDQLLVAAAS